MYVLVVVAAATSPTAPTGPTGGGLSYSSRCAIAPADDVYVYSYVAYSTGSISSLTVSSSTSTAGEYIGIIAFAVSGAGNSVSPFDPASTCGSSSSTSTLTASPTVTTTSGDADLVVGLLGYFSEASTVTASTGSGSTSIQIGTAISCYSSGECLIAAKYQSFTSASSSESQSFSLASRGGGGHGTYAWAMGADAFVSSSQIPDLPVGIVPFLIAVAAMYLVMRRKSVRSLESSRGPATPRANFTVSGPI